MTEKKDEMKVYNKVYNNEPDEVIITTSDREIYNLCKTCAFQSDGTAFSNEYYKTCCMMYPYPAIKPSSIMNGSGKCDKYLEDSGLTSKESK